MATIDTILEQIGNEPNPADQIRRLAEIVSESTDAMSATTDRLEQKAAQLHNHEATVGTAVAAGHVRAGSGLEILSDGTLNVALTAEGIVRRPLSVVPQPGAVPVAGADGTLGDWAIPPDLATQTTPGIVKGSDTVEIGEDGSVNVVAGGAVVISPPVVTVPPQVAIGFAFEIGLTAGPVLLPGATVTAFEVSVDGGSASGEIVSVPAVNGKATHSFTPQGEPGATLVVSAVTVDSLGNRSAACEVSTLHITASVGVPDIISPMDNAGVIDKNITVVTSVMSIIGGVTDTFIGADYTIYSIDGNSIATAKGIAATSHVFAAPPVKKGSYYDIGVVHHAEKLGASLESDKRRIKILDTRYGEILYDTGGNPAAVIIGSNASNGQEPWNIHGKLVWLAVALAATRSISIPWNTSNVDTNWQDISSIENPAVTWKLASNNTAPDGNGNYVSSQSSEANMDGSFGYSQAIKDSKALTDAIVAHNSNYQAAKIARQLVLKDLGAMDLPRIEALMRIYQMRDKIDALDPTASANTAKKLAAWGFGSAGGAHVWSASEGSSSFAWYEHSNGGLGSHYEYAQFGVVPVLEIPA